MLETVRAVLMEREMVCVLLAPTLTPPKFSGLGVAVTTGVGTECGATVKVEPAETEVTEFKVFPVRSVTFTVPSLTVTVVEVPSVSTIRSVPRTPTAELAVSKSIASQGSNIMAFGASAHRFTRCVTVAQILPNVNFSQRVPVWLVGPNCPVKVNVVLAYTLRMDPSGILTTAELFGPVASVSPNSID